MTVRWEFPCLEIPEAPLQNGGATLRSSLSRDLRGSNTKRRRFTRGCTTWGSTTNSVCKKSTYICSNLLERLWGSITSFCVQEVDLHLFKPLGKVVGVHNKSLCVRSRPTSDQSLAQSTDSVRVFNKIRGRFFLWNRLKEQHCTLNK